MLLAWTRSRMWNGVSRALRAVRGQGIDGSGRPVYDSAQRGSPALEELAALIVYRDVVLQLVRSDLVTRYKRSYLGVLWTMLNPLSTLIILLLAFSHVFQATPAYATYVICGLMVWNFFTYATTMGLSRLMYGSRSAIGVYVPRTAFAVASVVTALVNLLFATVPILLVMVCSGVKVPLTVLILPLPMLLLGCFALGVVLLLGSIAVGFPDIVEMYNLALPGWMYLTPIFYPVTILSRWTRSWLWLVNPLYPLVQLYRMPFANEGLPTVGHVAVVTFLSVGTLVAGWCFFCAKVDELCLEG